MATMKLYGRTNSINVRKVLWAAAELGVAVEQEDWGRGYRALSSPEFERLNPFGAIPVIDDDGFILRESHAIVRYLAVRQSAAKLFPQDLETRFSIEAWMDWAGSDLYWGVRPVFFAHAVNATSYGAETVARAAADWTEKMHKLDRHLAARGPYLMGADFTIADIPAGLVVNRWFGLDFAKPELPAVSAYHDLLATRPAYRLHGRNGLP